MRTTLTVVSAFCLAFVGCARIYGPLEEVKALMAAKDEVLREISKKLEAAPNAAGVDEARKVFEARRAELKAKRDAIDAQPPGANSDWRGLLMESNIRDSKMWQAIGPKFSTDCIYVAHSSVKECSSAEERLSALEKDFVATVRSR